MSLQCLIQPKNCRIFPFACKHWGFIRRFLSVVPGLFARNSRRVNNSGGFWELFWLDFLPRFALPSRMKTLPALALLVAAVAASAQSRFEVLRIYVHPTEIVGESWVDVGTNEVARVVDFRRTWTNAFLATTYPGGAKMATTNLVQVVGPCRLELFSVSFTAPDQEAVATVELFPNGASPVQRTAVAPAGWPVAVRLESSVDLVTWQTATNGAWPASDAHRFFRVSLCPTVATNAP